MTSQQPDIHPNSSAPNGRRVVMDDVAIRRALDEVSLADLLRTNAPLPQFKFAGMPVTVERLTETKD